MRNGLRVVALVAAKDLRQRLRDRSAILVAVIAPLGLAFIFSRLLAGATGFHATYAVADLDRGPMAIIFREQVLGQLEAADVVTVIEHTTEADALADVESGAADAAFILPAGFSDAVQGAIGAAGAASGGSGAGAGGGAGAGNGTGAAAGAVLRVVGARDEGLATEIARSIAEQFGDGVRGTELAVATVARLRGTPLGADTGTVTLAASTAGRPVAVANDETSLRQLSLPTYFSASMAILFLFFSAQIGLVSLFEERRMGTLARILAGPVAPWSVLAGKAAGGVVQALVSMAVLVVATTLLIGADWGPPLGVGLMVVASIASATGITALVVSFARSTDSAGAASSAVAITLGVLGGTFTPTAQAPEALNILALLTPNGWFMRGLGDMQGATGSVADALPAAGVLLLIGLGTGVVGFARVRSVVRAR